jgi:hypothetical protein
MPRTIFSSSLGLHLTKSNKLIPEVIAAPSSDYRALALHPDDCARLAA